MLTPKIATQSNKKIQPASQDQTDAQPALDTRHSLDMTFVQRAIQNPNTLTPAVVIQLQRLYGNAFVQRLVAQQPRQQVATSHPTIIQRKMGFELETGNEAILNGKFVGRKDLIYDDRTHGFKIEGDTHSNFEFITDPLDSVTALTQAADAAADVAYSLIDKPVQSKADDPNWKGTIKAQGINGEKLDQAWKADIQVTEGVEMDQLSGYIDDHIDEKERGYANMANQATGTASVDGLLKLIIYYVNLFQKWDGSNNEEGPKNAPTFMQRTDFASMYRALGQQKQAFKQLFFGQTDTWIATNPVTNATGLQGSGKVMVNKYMGYIDGKEKKIDNPLTLQEWIYSIINNEKDEMSPPKGWDMFDSRRSKQSELDNEPRAYGMGKLSTDNTSVNGTPLALLEYRKTDDNSEARRKNPYGSGKSVDVSVWSAWIEEHYTHAKTRNRHLP